MRVSHTKEEIAAYYKARRERWADSKKKAETDQTAQALLQESGMQGVSLTSFHYIYTQMLEQKLSGIPYVHVKTFDKWKSTGFKVKKGAKSTIEGLTWIRAENKKSETAEDYLFPKVYHLFHESQVEAIA